MYFSIAIDLQIETIFSSHTLRMVSQHSTRATRNKRYLLNMRRGTIINVAFVQSLILTAFLNFLQMCKENKND